MKFTKGNSAFGPFLVHKVLGPDPPPPTSLPSMQDLKVEDMNVTMIQYRSDVNKLARDLKQFDVWAKLKDSVEQFKRTLPLLTDLKNEAMRERHWLQLMEEIEIKFDPYAQDFTMDKVAALRLDKYPEFIANLSISATQVWRRSVSRAPRWRGRRAVMWAARVPKQREPVTGGARGDNPAGSLCSAPLEWERAGSCSSRSPTGGGGKGRRACLSGRCLVHSHTLKDEGLSLQILQHKATGK